MNPTLFDITHIAINHGANYSHRSEGGTHYDTFQCKNTGAWYALIRGEAGEILLRESATGRVVAQGLTGCWQEVNRIFGLRPQLKLNL